MNKVFPIRSLWCAVLLCVAALPELAPAQLKIEITSGVTDPVPVAIVPFANADGANNGVDVAQVIQGDLEGKRPLQGHGAHRDDRNAIARAGRADGGLEDGR